MKFIRQPTGQLDNKYHEQMNSLWLKLVTAVQTFIYLMRPIIANTMQKSVKCYCGNKNRRHIDVPHKRYRWDQCTKCNHMKVSCDVPVSTTFADLNELFTPDLASSERKDNMLK